jgi:hypothetical protein
MNCHRTELTARIGIVWEDLKVTKITTFGSKKEAAGYERVLRGKPFTGWNRAKGGGGGGMEGHNHSKETREKMSAAGAGKTLSPEHRSKIAAATVGNTRALGHKHTDKSIARMSAAQKGIRPTPESRARMSASAKNRSDEHRAKLSAAQKVKTGTKSGSYRGPLLGTEINSGEILHRFEGSGAADAAGFNHGSIYAVINGKRKTHKGCYWHRGAIT